MDITNINALVEKRYLSIHDAEDGAFGQWISSLWGWFPELTLEEQKEAFLILLKQLLDDGKVFLEEPADAPFGSREFRDVEIWDGPHDAMIQYIRDHWPNDIEHEDDIKLTEFWYDIHCPRIGWIDPEDGSIVAS